MSDRIERDNDRWRELRQRAEAMLDGQFGDEDGPAVRDAHALIQELRVAQIELELQNEELREAQESLLASRSRYQSLFHDAPVGYVVLDEIGIILQVNEACCRILGRTADQLRHRSLRSFVAEDQRPAFDRRLGALLRRREPELI